MHEIPWNWTKMGQIKMVMNMDEEVQICLWILVSKMTLKKQKQINPIWIWIFQIFPESVYAIPIVFFFMEKKMGYGTQRIFPQSTCCCSARKALPPPRTIRREQSWSAVVEI